MSNDEAHLMLDYEVIASSRDGCSWCILILESPPEVHDRTQGALGHCQNSRDIRGINFRLYEIHWTGIIKRFRL